MTFTFLRDMLMAQHGWCRRVATLAARLYLGVDTIDDIAACEGFHGRALLTEAEYREICRWR
ncbi:MAG: hypothetical protein ACYS7Y_31890 [Planctomycetota bacterium]|jgi:hypothetical protein